MIYRRKSSEFSMRHRVRLLLLTERTAFVEILYPESWGLKNKETVLGRDLFEKEYVECRFQK